MSIDETAMLLAGQLVRNHCGTFYFDKPGVWTDGRGWPESRRLHRVDGPAIVWADGTQEWWVEGQLHRVDGPAIIYADGDQVWCSRSARLDKSV
jgi:hypothetical protein